MIYVYDKDLGKVVPKHAAGRRLRDPTAIQDTLDSPFESPIDGRMIESRSELRRHNREHGVEQCGDYMSLENVKARREKHERTRPSAFGEDFRRELGSRMSEAGWSRQDGW